MKYSSGTNQELLDEISNLKRKIKKLEKLESNRNQSEKALLESKERYRSLVDNINFGINLIDKDFKIKTANVVSGRQFNKPASALLGKYCFKEFEKRQTVCEHCPGIIAMATSEAHQVDTEGIRDDGSTFAARIHAFPLFYPDGSIRGFNEVVEDITERKQTENKLREQEEKYRALFNNAEVSLFRTRASDGKLLAVNKRYAETAGYSNIEECTVKFNAAKAWFDPNERKNLLKILQEKGFVRDFEAEIICGDETHRWISFSATFFPEQDVIEGSLTDITDRKRTEKKLQASESLYQAMFENAGNANILVHEDTTIILVNSEFEQLSGYSKEEIEGKKGWMEFFVEEDLSRMIQYHRQRRTGDHAVPRKYECRLKHRNGCIKDIAISVDMIPSTKESIASLHDLTERKQAERIIQESQRRLADIIEFLPDATLVIDKDGKVIAWNRAIEIMTGVKKEDMIGKDNHEYAMPFYGDRRNILVDLVLHPDREIKDNYMAIQRVGDILLGEARTKNLLIGNIHLSGTASVLRGNNGEIIAAIECIRDNTERKRLEERLNRAEKMESLGLLAGGVAHDLNNALGAVVGYAEMLLGDMDESHPMKDELLGIMNGGQRAAAIVQDLLTLARRGVAGRKILNLNRLILDFTKSPEWQKLLSYHPSVQIKTDLAPDLLNISASSVHLEKTLINLVSNACEAMAKSGYVTIRTTNQYLDRPLHGYDSIREGDYVVFSVSDTGEGIQESDLKRIFEPFYTKKIMGRSGTGLGLAVVWGTVKDHQGYINVESERGQGTIFTIHFPVAREDVTVKSLSVPVSEYMGNGESILVVDDIKGQRDLAAAMLKKLNYKVVSIASGEDAVEYLKDHKVDLLVMDMIMDPGMDGLDTYRNVLTIHPQQKAIIVSGFSDSDRVHDAQSLGAGAYVKKPYITEKLGLAVRNELDRK